MKQILLAVIIFLTTASSAQAQLKIGKFYSQGTKSTSIPDWIELVNDSGTEINLKDYKIRDTASSDVFAWDYDMKISANGSCVLEVEDRLNKSGDIIYLLDNNSQEVFCLFYGNGNKSEGCDNKTDDLGLDENKPVDNCSKPTPTPSPTKKPTPTPTPKPTTPAPTVVLTAKPTVKPTVLLTPKPKASVSPSPTSEVLSISDTAPDTPEPSVEEKDEAQQEDNDFLSNFSLLIGGFLILASTAFVIWKEYNERHLP